MTPIHLNIKGNCLSSSSYIRKPKIKTIVHITLKIKTTFQAIGLNICISKANPNSPIHIIIEINLCIKAILLFSFKKKVDKYRRYFDNFPGNISFPHMI